MTSTRSPTVRLIGKRPPSISGATRSTTTRRRPLPAGTAKRLRPGLDRRLRRPAHSATPGARRRQRRGRRRVGGRFRRGAGRGWPPGRLTRLRALGRVAAVSATWHTKPWFPWSAKAVGDRPRAARSWRRRQGAIHSRHHTQRADGLPHPSTLPRLAASLSDVDCVGMKLLSALIVVAGLTVPAAGGQSPVASTDRRLEARPSGRRTGARLQPARPVGQGPDAAVADGPARPRPRLRALDRLVPLLQDAARRAARPGQGRSRRRGLASPP